MKKFLVALALTMCVGFGGVSHTYAFADETYDDLAQLEKYCGLEISGDYDNIVKTLQENYEYIRIKFTAHDHKANEYYDKREGKQISRLSALQMLVDFGHRNGRYGKG